MAKTTPKAKTESNGKTDDVLRLPSEIEYATELEALKKSDKDEKPEGWLLSPRSVRTYILGGKAGDVTIKPKYLGNQRVVEIAIATLATDRALLLTGEPGTAKCVKHDTLVLDTRTGERLTIAEACRRRAVSVASLDSEWRLSEQVPKEYLDNGVRPCFRVTTHLGRSIEVTLNHPFLTLDGWRPLSQLKVGEQFAVPRTMPFFGSGDLSDAHVRVLAHLIAEGCLTSRTPYFSNKNVAMQQDFSTAVATGFPELKANWYPDGTYCSISQGRLGPFRKNPCTQWLTELGLMGTDSSTKFIPPIIFTLPRRQIALFLNRLFSGDGCLQKRPSTGQVTVDYASKSSQLIKDVQHLLLRFGINARVICKRTGHFRLYIQGRGPCLTFLREIGFLNKPQTQEIADELAQSEQMENPNLDVIPARIWRQVESAAVAAGFTNATALAKAERGDCYTGGGPRRTQGVSRHRLLRLAEYASDQQLEQLAQSDVYWDRIVGIEPIGDHQVFDLSMSGPHNFVANDIIVHNSWLSEHLTAAICGDSLQVVQGTAGTTEEQVRYSWNYALLLSEGPSERALVPSPVYRAMALGKIIRFEEISRVPSEIQDSLITILSEKMMAVPELGFHVSAKRGFSLIATANSRDRGVNDMSAALTRRFNKVVLPVPSDVDTEVLIVRKRIGEIKEGLRLPAPAPTEEAVRKIVQVFQELRRGQTLDGKQKIKPPSGVLSTAEAISLFGNSMSLAGHFGDGKVSDRDIAAGLHGIVIKEDERDLTVWVEYLENVMKKRGAEWRDLYTACKELT